MSTDACPPCTGSQWIKRKCRCCTHLVPLSYWSQFCSLNEARGLSVLVWPFICTAARARWGRGSEPRRTQRVHHPPHRSHINQKTDNKCLTQERSQNVSWSLQKSLQTFLDDVCQMEFAKRTLQAYLLTLPAARACSIMRFTLVSLICCGVRRAEAHMILVWIQRPRRSINTVLMRGDITSLCYGLIMLQLHLVTLRRGPDLAGH